MKNHAVIIFCQTEESRANTCTLLTFICALVWQCYAGNTSEEMALIQKTTCTCSGYNVTYECTVMGSHFGNTIWAGSAFNCSLEEITLQHLQFPENAHGECNNGYIMGKSIRVVNGTYMYYTSQLNVTISSDLVGKSIECFYDDNTGMKQLVGAKNITITTDQFRPPNIESANLTSDRVKFAWNQAVNDSECPALHYNLASDCGRCPTTTNHTTIACTDVATNGSICTFAVWTVVCGNITGDADEVCFNLTYTNTSEVLSIPSSLATFITVCTVVFVVIGTIISVILLWLVIKWRRIGVWTKSWGTKNSHSVGGLEMTDVCKVSCDNENIDYTTIKIVDNKNIGVYGLEDVYSKTPAVETSPIQDTSLPPLDLDSVLRQLSGQATLRWYSFGLEFGVPQDILEQLKEYPESQCLIEVLDYWLRHHPSQPNWHEVAEAQKKVYQKRQ